MIKIPAIQYQQGERTLFLGIAKASDLLSMIDIDAWTPENPGGYQRSLKARRCKRFANFLSHFGGLFHQTVLINIRDAKSISFSAITGNVGTLEVRGKLYQVDGQHRLGGVKVLLDSQQTRVKFADLPIPVLIMAGLDKPQEALQFFIVNTTQVGVKADLRDRLIADVIGPLLTPDFLLEVIGTREKRDIVAEAVELADELNENAASVWRGRIAIPEQKLAPTQSISQRSFTESVKAVLKNDIIQATFEKFPDDLVDPLLNYWDAIRQLCPKATGDRFKDYEMLKTKGAEVLHSVFPQVVLYSRGDHTQQKFKSILQDIDEMNDPEWSKTGKIGKLGTGQKVFSQIREMFVEQLKDAFTRK